jgi:cytochrome c
MVKGKVVLLALGVCLAFAAFATPDGESKGDVERGKKIFDGQCADCHFPDSTDEKFGPGLKGIKDGKLPSGKPATHDALLEIVNDGVGDEMPPFQDTLTDQQKEDVVAYVRTL